MEAAVILARIKFAFTIGFHFIFPAITIGMAWIILYMITRYWRGGEELYGQMARFWVKIFGVTFAMGVATGITMEFQFGMNWSEYSRFVGDIFGAPLAAEGIFSFFLESTFLGILLFGWKRFSKKTLWLASLMVAVGATLSAFWILAANSWQQTPAGYHIVNSRAELTSFLQAVFNPSTIPRFFHTVVGAMITGAFFMMGMSAWYLIRGKHKELAARSLKITLTVAFFFSILQLFTGHLHGVQVARTQPEKLAVLEGHFETHRRAPALLFGIPSRSAEKVYLPIKIPGLLSVFAYGDANAVVAGLKDYPKEDWPPFVLTFYPFHIMVALGGIMLLFTAFGMYLLIKERLYDHKKFLKWALYAIPLPHIANQLGWMSAEVGRQPWAVYHLLRTKDAVSISVPAFQIFLALVFLVIVYAILFLIWVYVLRLLLERGPGDSKLNAEAEGSG